MLACLRMLFHVPSGMSLPSLPPPGTVTVPGFSGCRNGKWLPAVRSRNQPSASRNLIASRYFIHQSSVRRAGWPVLLSAGGPRNIRPTRNSVQRRVLDHHQGDGPVKVVARSITSRHTFALSVHGPVDCQFFASGAPCDARDCPKHWC